MKVGDDDVVWMDERVDARPVMHAATLAVLASRKKRLLRFHWFMVFARAMGLLKVR